MKYDKDNIFAKILRGEIPCNKIFENEFALAFDDISPQAPIHILVIPKGSYKSMDDFSEYANDSEISGLIRAVGFVAKKFNLVNPGYRIISNHGVNAHQEVGHFHIHLLGGRDLHGILK